MSDVTNLYTAAVLEMRLMERRLELNRQIAEASGKESGEPRVHPLQRVRSAINGRFARRMAVSNSPEACAA